MNGVTGGNGTVGTIQGSTSSLTGTYTAPGTQPNPSVVLAGVWLGAKGRRGDTFVASNLSVGTPGTYQGKVTVTATGLFAYTASGNLTVTPGKLLNGQLDDGIDMTLFDVTGSIKISDAITYSGFPCTADSPSQAVKNTSLNLKKVPLSVLWGLGIQWDLTCDINGTPTKTAAILTWLTGCMPNTVDQNFIPIADPKDIKGSYTRGGANCPQAAGLAATVEWDFLMQ